MTTTKITPAMVHQKAKQIVRMEVHSCLSMLVDQLTEDAKQQLWEDYNDTGVEGICSNPECGEVVAHAQSGFGPDDQAECRYCGHKTHQDEIEWRCPEILEHWHISKTLAEDLVKQGEAISESLGMTIWGRCTSGQSIDIDYCIEKIAKEQLNA